MVSKMFIVGISGVTNGGKTTVADKLKESLSSDYSVEIFHQDAYFYPPEGKPWFNWIEELNHFNWDEVHCLDMAKLHNDMDVKIKDIKSNSEKAIIILEGHLIFNYKPLLEYFNKMYYLTLDKESVIERRKFRTYDPPDPPGYFETCVWPMHLQHFEEVQKIPNINYIDAGGKDPDECLRIVEQDLRKFLYEQTAS